MSSSTGTWTSVVLGLLLSLAVQVAVSQTIYVNSITASGAVNGSYALPQGLYNPTTPLNGPVPVRSVALSGSSLATLVQDGSVVVCTGGTCAAGVLVGGVQAIALVGEHGTGPQFYTIGTNGSIYKVSTGASSSGFRAVSVCALSSTLMCAIVNDGTLWCGQFPGLSPVTNMLDVLELSCNNDHFAILHRPAIKDRTVPFDDTNPTDLLPIAQAADKNVVMTSTDGVTWTTVNLTGLFGRDSTYSPPALGVIEVAAAGTDTYLLTTEGTLVMASAVGTAILAGGGATFDRLAIATVFAEGDTTTHAIINAATGDVFYYDGTTATLLNNNQYDLGFQRITQAAVLDTGVAMVTEGMCSWFTQYQQMNWNLDDSRNNISYYYAARRDLSACGMCAGYGTSCLFSMNPVEMYEGDFGHSSLGGLCLAIGGNGSIATADQRAQGAYTGACILDNYLYGYSRRYATGVSSSTGLGNVQHRYRSEVWFPFPEDDGNNGFRYDNVSYPTYKDFMEVVWPNLYARYFLQVPHRYMVVRLVAMTNDARQLGDNIDFIAMFSIQSKCSRLTLDNNGYTSIRESNPWAIDIRQPDVYSSFDGVDIDGTAQFGGLCFSVYGDNQYPQKSGPSEYKLKIFIDPFFPDFMCIPTIRGFSYTNTTNFDTRYDACFNNNLNADWSAIQDPNVSQFPVDLYPNNPSLSRIDQRILPFGNIDRFRWQAADDPTASPPKRYIGLRLNRRTYLSPSAGARSLQPLKGQKEYYNGFVWGEELFFKEGFETKFSFVIQNQYLCNGDDGFCGGGEGFAWFIHGVEGRYNPTTDFTGVHDAWRALGSNEAYATQVMGLGGQINMLAVEFDTWHNPNYYDPKQGVEMWYINATEIVSYADNHIAIFATAGSQGNCTILTNDHSTDCLVAATPSVPDMSDGQVHSVMMWYLPAFGTHPGTLTVFMDNMDRPVLVGEMTLLERTYNDTSSRTFGPTDWNLLNINGGGYTGFVGAQNDAPQDLTLTSWEHSRYPGSVGY